MGKEKITFEQIMDPAFRRAEQMKVKSEAVWVTFHELDGLINVSKLAKTYFNKSQAWLAQKIDGFTVNGKVKEFTTEEFHQLADALRDVARRLNEYADAIDEASIE